MATIGEKVLQKMADTNLLIDSPYVLNEGLSDNIPRFDQIIRSIRSYLLSEKRKEWQENILRGRTTSQSLLSIALEYKTEKYLNNVDWETVRSKYDDIYERFVTHLVGIAEGETHSLNNCKDYPHRPEEISKASVASKLKGIRTKYRKAVDAGRKSGQGRVVELYFTLCQEIWGGSPATEQLHSGLESADLIQANQTEDSNLQDEEGEPAAVCVNGSANTHELTVTLTSKQKGKKTAAPATNTPVPSSSTNNQPVGSSMTGESHGNGNSTADTGKQTSKKGKKTAASNANTPGPSGYVPEESGEAAKRRKLLDDKLSNYKQRKLAKKIATDSIAEDRDFRKDVLQQLKESDRSFENNMKKMSDTMEKLSGAILSGFNMLQQVVLQPQAPIQSQPHIAHRVLGPPSLHLPHSQHSLPHGHQQPGYHHPYTTQVTQQPSRPMSPADSDGPDAYQF